MPTAVVLLVVLACSVGADAGSWVFAFCAQVAQHNGAMGRFVGPRA